MSSGNINWAFGDGDGAEDLGELAEKYDYACGVDGLRREENCGDELGLTDQQMWQYIWDRRESGNRSGITLTERTGTHAGRCDFGNCWRLRSTGTITPRLCPYCDGNHKRSFVCREQVRQLELEDAGYGNWSMKNRDHVITLNRWRLQGMRSGSRRRAAPDAHQRSETVLCAAHCPECAGLFAGLEEASPYEPHDQLPSVFGAERCCGHRV